MHPDRLPPRARARLAAVLGVLVAVALIGVSISALRTNVLGFSDWPGVRGSGARSIAVPDAPMRASRDRGDHGGRAARRVAGAVGGPIVAGAAAPLAATAVVAAGGAPAGATPVAGGATPVPGGPGADARGQGVIRHPGNDARRLPHTAQNRAGPKTARPGPD